jgi:hypothetical protein
MVSNNEPQRGIFMRFNVLIVLLSITNLGHGREAKPQQSGTLLQMDSVECGVDENSGKSLAGEIIGTDSAHKKSRQLLCPEYLLQTDKIIYRIRPKDDKHPVLLPVGEKAQFRMEKDKLVLRVEDLDDKPRSYTVVSMTPREQAPPK